MKKIFIIKKAFSFLIFFPMSLIARFFLTVGKFFLFISSLLVYQKSGNHYFKNFKTDLFIKKKIFYKKLYIVVRINNFWDYWRINNFEKYPIEIITRDLEEYKKKNKKITYYEIGANVGYSSIIISKIIENNGESFVFEIEPTNFKTLNDNIIINNLKNIKPFNTGIYSENNIFKFYYNTKYSNNKSDLPISSMGMHSLKFDNTIHKKNVYYHSQVMKFSEILRIYNLQKPTHLYIDAYGVENEILESIIDNDENFHPNVIMIDIEELIEKIEDSKIYKLLNNHNYVLVHSLFEKGNTNIPNSYKSVFSKKL